MRANFAYTAYMLTVAVVAAACGPDSGDAPAAKATSTGTTGSPGAGGSGTTSETANTGDSTNTGGSATTGESSDGSGGSQTETTGTGGAGGTGDSDALYGVVQYGTIYHYPGPGMVNTVAMAYFRFPQSDTSSSCETTTIGSCYVTECEGGELTREPAIPDAGTIQIRSTGDFTADFLAAGNGEYTATALGGPLAGGETITITAEGGGVPAFTHTMEYPLVMMLTDPVFDDVQTEYAVSRAFDLPLAWDRGFEGLKFQVQSQSPGANRVLACSFPAETGAGTIDSDLLRMLDQGTQLLLLGVETDVVKAGDVEVSISSVSTVMTPDRARRAVVILE